MPARRVGWADARRVSCQAPATTEIGQLSLALNGMLVEIETAFVVNLVGNVIAHTPPGAAVRIGVGTTGGEAVLEIAGSGPGLSPEQATRVFDRFCRADSLRARTEVGGAGLGLAIVKSMVAAHSGRVELDTGPGGGATFRVIFPVLQD